MKVYDNHSLFLAGVLTGLLPTVLTYTAWWWFVLHLAVTFLNYAVALLPAPTGEAQASE